eukprot:tig00000615_g2550.t1
MPLYLANFGDANAGDVDVPSTWRTNRSLRSAQAQTEEQELYDVEIQTLHKLSVEVQTDASAVRSSKNTDPNSRELQDFLRRVAPDVEQQLEVNARSRAFQDYDVVWEQERGEVRCLHRLYHRPAAPAAAAEDDEAAKQLLKQQGDPEDDAARSEFPAAALSWNATGWTVAVAYGKFDHKGSCAHRSALRTWNVGRRTMVPTKADTSIEVPCCLMSCAFHPEKPSILAAGGFNGDLFLFDLARTDEQRIGQSRVTEISHREAIMKIEWLYDVRERQWDKLATVSTDGRVLIWSLKNAVAHPIDGAKLEPREGESKKADDDDDGPRRSAARSVIRGGTALSFSKQDRTTYVVGTETGSVYKCFSSGVGAPVAPKPDAPPPKITFTTPIKFTFAGHSGAVHDADTSPFHRNVFLTGSADGAVRVYHMLQRRPLLTLEPSPRCVYAVQWSRSRPLVFAAAAGDGMAYVYDLEESALQPSVRLEAGDVRLEGGDQQRRLPVYAVAFNPRMPDMLATGDSCGTIKVWQLNSHLSNAHPREQETLNKMAATTEEEDGTRLAADLARAGGPSASTPAPSGPR